VDDLLSLAVDGQNSRPVNPTIKVEVTVKFFLEILQTYRTIHYITVHTVTGNLVKLRSLWILPQEWGKFYGNNKQYGNIAAWR